MIVLVPYDPDWPSQFAAVRDEILSACGGLVIEVHHIGSTSIPGIAAKPIIDMMPAVRRFRMARPASAARRVLCDAVIGAIVSWLSRHRGFDS
jgi:GrpB-like predicted nucleotidyltransferase (UPF0157 family)